MAGGIEVRPHAGRPRWSNTPSALHDREVRIQRRKAGVCTQCGGKRRRGKFLCQRCADTIKQSNERMRTKRKAAGVCWECGSPSQGRVRCMTCVIRRNARPSRQNAYRQAEYRATARRAAAKRK